MLLKKIELSIIVFLLMAVIAGQTKSERIPEPEGVFYYQPSAAVFGLEASWVNPAALGNFYPGGFQVMADQFDNDYARSWGAAVCRDKLALTFRNLDIEDDTYKEIIFAGGFPVFHETTLGISYRYFKDGPGFYHHRHTWNIGFVTRGKGILSFAALWSNLNRSKIEGERSSMEQRYGLSYRPYGPKITFSVDMFLSTQNNIKEADYIYHVEYIPYPGLFLNGYVDSDKNFQVGFRVNLLKYFVGSRSGFSRHGDYRSTTAFVGATTLRQPSIIKESARRLAVNVSGRVLENPPRPVFGRSAIPFAGLITNLYQAATDPTIKEAVIDLNSLALGFGQAQELREALLFFKSKGKLITCYLTSPNNISYYVAVVADRILIPPVCELYLVGLKAELTFYAATLEKVGVKADLMRIGAYKTAPERFTHNAASEENRRQVNHLLDITYDEFVTAISESRHITIDSVKNIIDNGPFTSEDALRFGLVDGLAYRDEVHERFLTGMPEISFKHYLSDTLINDDWRKPPVLAVVVAEGDITYTDNVLTNYQGGEKATPAQLNQAFNQVARDDRVKGIILRINSPGGYALAGEDIYHGVSNAAAEKPLLVSMANVAASGGYYIAMPAKKIFANPASITGSIGIFGGKLDLSGLFEKISLGKELYTRGRFAGMMSYTRPFSDEEREKYFNHMKAFYEHYLRLVANNRALSVDSIDQLAQGRVYNGREAKRYGLVDELGGLKNTLEYMAAQLNLDSYRIELYPVHRPLFVLPGGFLTRALAGIFGSENNSLKVLEKTFGLAETGELYTRMPYDITIE